MKYRIICLTIIISLLISTVAFKDFEFKPNRYHQHLEASEKAECTEHTNDVFCTHLPLINITTDAEMPGAYTTDENGNYVKNVEMVSATVEYFDNEKKNNHLSDVPVIKEKALIRIRGTSSRKFDKNGYLLKFKEADLIKNKKVSLSGMTADNEWVLHGPFLDKTLIRNYLCYNLAGEIMDYAPNVRFCEAYLNGEYIGVYLIVEKIGYSKNGKLQIEKSDPDIAETSYVVKIDRKSNDEIKSISTFSREALLGTSLSSNAGHMTITYPSITTLTQAQRSYIIADISRFEKSIYSFDYDDKKNGYSKYIDVESFIDYYLINEFTLNYDASTLSRYFYKDIGGKLKMCVWDFNSAFDYYEFSTTETQTFEIQSSIWYVYLFKDSDFVDMVIERYLELRQSYFSEEYLLNYIDETVEYLGPAITRNYEKWGYSFQSEYNGKSYDFLYPAERNVRDYDEAIAQLKSCICERAIFMDNNIDRLATLSHASLNKKYNYDK